MEHDFSMKIIFEKFRLASFSKSVSTGFLRTTLVRSGQKIDAVSLKKPRKKANLAVFKKFLYLATKFLFFR